MTRLHNLAGFPKYTLHVSFTMRAAAVSKHTGPTHPDDDSNAKVMVDSDEETTSANLLERQQTPPATA